MRPPASARFFCTSDWFVADSALEGAVTSELVSGIRRNASFWHFIPAYARVRARQGSDENLATAGRSAAGKLVSEVKSQSLQVDLM